MNNITRMIYKSTTGCNKARNETMQREDSTKKNALNLSHVKSEYRTFLISISFIISVPT